MKIVGTNALCDSTVYRWYGLFDKSKYDTQEHRGGDHVSNYETEERTQVIQAALDEQRTWSTRALSAQTGIPKSTVQRILKEKLKMKKINAKWVPHELSPGQMETRVVYCKSNLKEYNQQTSRLTHTITIDETWVSLYRPPEKDQAKQWLKKGERSTQVARPDRYGPKVMMILAMDIKGIFYYELLHEKETVNATKYLDFLKKVMEKFKRGRKHTVWLLDDNARPHRSPIINQFLEEKNIQRWLQPPYSPDISPCDYGCFHPLKREIGGKAYADVNSLKAAIDNEVKEGNKGSKYKAVEKLPERWKKCIDVKGEYI